MRPSIFASKIDGLGRKGKKRTMLFGKPAQVPPHPGRGPHVVYGFLAISPAAANPPLLRQPPPKGRPKRAHGGCISYSAQRSCKTSFKLSQNNKFHRFSQMDRPQLKRGQADSRDMAFTAVNKYPLRHHFVPIEYCQTNNIAELLAVLRALQISAPQYALTRNTSSSVLREWPIGGNSGVGSDRPARSPTSICGNKYSLN